MWIFTRKGFISAVAWTDCKSTLCVRARTPDHLAALFPNRNIIVSAAADYRYRCRVERKFFEGVIAAEIRLIDYGNFKAQIADHAYHDALLAVWRAMLDLQEPRRRVWTADRQTDLWAPNRMIESEDTGDDPDEELPWP